MIIRVKDGDKGLFGGYAPNGKVILIDKQYHESIKAGRFFSCVAHEKDTYYYATDLKKHNQITNLELSEKQINNIVRMAARKFVNPSNHILFDMCVDFGYEGVIALVEFYDPDHGLSQEGFLYMCARDCIITNLKRIEFNKLRNNNTEFTSDDVFGQYIEDHETNLDEMTLVDRCCEYLAKRGNVHHFTCFMFRHVMEKQFTEMAVILGGSASSWNEIDKCVMKILRNMF